MTVLVHNAQQKWSNLSYKCSFSAPAADNTELCIVWFMFCNA